MSIDAYVAGTDASGRSVWRRRGRPDLVVATAELARRLALVLEVDEPTNADVGPMPGTLLRQLTGVQVITTPGTVVENFDLLDGYFDVRAPDVYIGNGRVRGTNAAPSGVRGLIHCTNAAVKRLTLEDLHLEPSSPRYSWNGVMGHDFTARRVLTRQTSDGFRIFNQAEADGPSGVSLLGCWVDRLRYWRDDPDQLDGTHGDCVQIQSCHSTLIRGCRLDAYLAEGSEQRYLSNGTELPGVTQALSAIMLNNDLSGRVSLDLLGNWIRGGDQPVNGGSSKLAGMDLGRAWRNLFDRGARIAGHTIDLDAQVTMDTGDGTANQNLYEDTLTAVQVRRNQ